MESILFILTGAALAIAFVARRKANSQAGRIENLEQELRRRTRTMSEKTDQKLELFGKLLTRVATGGTVTADMIAEGRLWQDVLPDDGIALVEKGDVFVLDVRSTEETKSGMLPGAVHIPISELEERYKELPKDGREKLIYCAGGGRSASACEFLSGEGFEGLNNLAGGISSWRGPVEGRKS